MNYRHGYHVGNFADVIKHSILISLVQALSRKEKPFCYIETHAGRGEYNLFSEFPQKTKEYTNGIARLMEIIPEKMPLLLRKYCEVVRSFQYPRFYPGSPAIVRSLLRKQDRMVLMEYQPEEFEHLKGCFRNDRQIGLHYQNGYNGLKAFLPPKEHRGLILIDPPFEQVSEWDQLLEAVQIGIKRFPNGVYAIWYPVKNQKIVKSFLESLVSLGLPEVLVVELSIYPTDANFNLIGCGLVIINPPWQLDKELLSTIPWLWEALSVNKAGYHSLYFLPTKAK
jgi:23S rRNA (adenine2030-N6)-methyltransferase